MNEYSKDLTLYRLQRAVHTLKVSRQLLDSGSFSDAVNRAYYSAFYAVNAVHALVGCGYKRRKDAVANFNKEYVASGKIDRSVGRDLSILERARNTGDYDDFQITSKQEAEANYIRAVNIVKESCLYCTKSGINLKQVELAYYAQPDEIQNIIDCTPQCVFEHSDVQEIIERYRQIVG